MLKIKRSLLISIILIKFLTHLIQCENRKVRILEDRRFASFVDIGSTVYYQALCLQNEATKIKMQCTSTDRIKILKTIYGFNPGYANNVNIESCALSVTDCNFDREYSVDNECTGRNSCLVTIRKSNVINESSIYQKTCNDFNYVQINYQCLPNLPSKSVCGMSKAELSHAYLMTPNFPNSISAGTTCECILTSNYENGQILLRRVDMKLPSDKANSKCSGGYLEILENDKRVERKCGYEREAGSIFGSGANKLKLTYVTDPVNSLYDRGFWLEVLASPPKPNHLIEIVCKESNGGNFNEGDNAMLTNSKNSNKNDFVQNIDIFKKLKQIHDKIKRLNKTFTDPKVNKLHDKTLKFLAKNNKKFLNMTNEIGIIGKKLSEKKLDNSNTLQTSSPGHKAKPTLSSFEDLENEIEKFFASKDTIGKQVDEFEKIKNKQNLKTKITLKQNSKDTQKEELVDDLSSIELGLKKKKKKTNKEFKLDLNNQNKLIHEETLKNNQETNDNDDENETESLIEKIKEKSKATKNKGKDSDDDWLKALEKLDEELDLGEKIISKDDLSAVDSIISSRISVSDSLAELMPDNRNNINQGQAAHLSVLPSGSASASNAHLQDLSHSSESQQSSSTEFEPAYDYDIYGSNANLDSHISTTRQHTILKRNTMKHKNGKIIKIQIKPKPGSSYSTTDSQIMENISTSSKVVVKAPAQWLEPFKFQKNNLNMSREIKNSLFNNRNSSIFKDLRVDNQPRLINKNPSEIFSANVSDVYLNSIDRTLTKLNQTYAVLNNNYTTISVNNISTKDILKSSSILNINDYFSCEKNLTRLTVFYSSLDRLNCTSMTRNSTLLKCFDELLEKKLLGKLGSFYYLNLRPLLIPKSKAICINRSMSILEPNKSLINESALLKNQMLESETNQISSIYFNEIEKENYLNENNFEHSLNCTLITKKSTNRKKLIWRLYLLLKNQTCIPGEPFKMHGHHVVEAVSTNKSGYTSIENDEYEKKRSTSSPGSLIAYLSKSPLSSNKIILIILITCGVCFIIFANTLLYIILKIRKKPAAVGNFNMSTSMNNRLLQNYLDLSVNSDAKNSIMSTPNKAASEQNLPKLTKDKPGNNFNASNIKCASDNYLVSNEKKLANEKKFESMEFKNIENFNSKETFQSNENNNKNNLSNVFGEVNVSDTDLNKMNILLKTFNENLSNRILNDENDKIKSQNDLSDYEFSNKMTLSCKSNNNESNKYEIIGRIDADDNQSKNSIVEINRIPSLRRTKYSVSTIATQADMEKGSMIAERKDFKYRNQEMSDVESQILSIEVDLGSEIGGAYGTINSDWYNNNRDNLRRFNLNPSHYSNNNPLALMPSTSKLSTLTNSFKDRFLSNRQECASVIVNDYSAFKNCLNFQLQAARAANMESKIEEQDSTKRSAFSKAVTSFKPKIDSHQQHPLHNRMIVRISSISSTKSASVKRVLTEKTMLTTTTTTTTTIENNKEKKSSSTLISSSSVIPLSTVSCSEGLSSTQSFESPSKRLSSQPFFSLDNQQNEHNESNGNKNLEPLVYEAYRAAVMSTAGIGSNSSSLSNSAHQFPNNLYMYLDSVPYFKSCFQDGLFPDDYKEKVNLLDERKNFKVSNNECGVNSPHSRPPPPPPPHTHPGSSASKLRQSSTLNTIIDLNDDSINSSKLEESFNKCFEVNASRFACRKNDNAKTFRIHENEISDPNTIYSQVETDENDTGKSMSDDEEENDSCSTVSCENTLAKKNLPNINQSSTSSVEKELASFNLCPNVGFTQRFNNERENPTTVQVPFEDNSLKMNKAERLKKMLEEERKALNLARKETPKYSAIDNYSIDSPRKQKRLRHAPASTYSKLNLKATENQHHYMRRPRDTRSKKVISSLFKINKRNEIKFQPKNKEEDDSTSSSIAAQKNVRFADNVSYI